MTDYDTLRVKVGRRPITVVELELDFCTNTYGVSPCTAAVGVTGPQKCFNTYSTCQDTANFAKGSKIYKFTEPNPLLPVGETYFPCITAVDIAPTQLKPGAFSVSASVTVTLQDFPHHDRGVDPYTDDRSYNPREQGTFFGKLAARNAVVSNRVMRVNTGYIDADRTVYTLTRTYFIDRIEGPDANGKVKVIGRDILRSSEIEKTKMPRAPTGTMASSVPGLGNFNISMDPTGVGATYPVSPFPNTFYAALDDEIIVAGVTGDVLNCYARGQAGTSQAGHAAGSFVREGFPRVTAAGASSFKPVEVIRDLLLAAGVDSSYIPYSAWETECDAYISTNAIETNLFEQESVKVLLESVLEDFGCALWWDELDVLIKFKVMSTAASATATLTDNENILAGSMTVKTVEKERISRVQISYGMGRTPGTTPDFKNMSRTQLVINTSAESANVQNGVVQKDIISRWIGRFSDTDALNIANRYLDRYSIAPREVTFKMDAKDSTVRTGDVIEILSRLLQGPDGSQSPVKFLVTQFHEVIVGTQYQYTALELPS